MALCLSYEIRQDQFRVLALVFYAVYFVMSTSAVQNCVLGAANSVDASHQKRQ